MVALTTTVDVLQSLKLTVPTPDIIAIREFEGTEGLSQPFEFSAFIISTSTGLAFDTLLGQSATISFDSGSGTRYFNGIIGEIWQRETARVNDDNVTLYGIKLYPQLWLLKFSTDCRIFQNMSVMEIVLKILQENLIVNIQNLVTTLGQTAREYCVQYNETHLDFISRLLEEEGIYYYFTHADGAHTLVLGDSPTGHQMCPHNNLGQFFTGMGSDYPENIVYQCKMIQRATVHSRSSADYNFTSASTPLYARIEGVGVSGGGNIYRYPGSNDHEDKPTQSYLENVVKLQLDRDLVNQRSLEGKSTQPFFTAGHQFILQGYDRPGSDGTYVVQSVQHHCTANTDLDANGQNIYTNDFQAFSISTPFRPPQNTIKPRIYSTQTAVVTGKIGEEIWTDKYGRIMVKFHWDQALSAAEIVDGKDSCWIRVADGWAGSNWGTRFTPRIGMEVLVTFLDGNPDRPLVTGCVWNSDNMPPYLPTDPTKSTIKTRSTNSTTDDEFNEIRFEDLQGSEQVYHRAQKDYDQYVIQNATTHIQTGSKWTWIDSGDLDVAVLAKDGAVEKTTPLGQNLPAGAGNYNLEITGGCWNIDQLAANGKANHNHYTLTGDYNYQIDCGDVFKLQRLGNWYQQLDEGNIEQSVRQGHVATTINVGDKRTFIMSGSENLQIGKGDQATLINQGTQYTNVVVGDRIKAIDTGSDYEILKEGSKNTTIMLGNHMLKMADGNQQVHILKGNQEKGLLDGNELNYINGDFSETVMKNYSLLVVENLLIQVAGNIIIEADGNINMNAGQNILLNAAENITLTAGTGIISTAGADIQQSARANVSIESGVNLTLASSFDVNCSAGASVAIESTLDTNIAAGIEVAIEGGASTTVLGGASVEIIGATIVMLA